LVPRKDGQGLTLGWLCALADKVWQLQLRSLKSFLSHPTAELTAGNMYVHCRPCCSQPNVLA